MLSSPLPSAPRSGRASRSCTPTRTSRRCSPPAPHAAARSTTRTPRSRRPQGALERLEDPLRADARPRARALRKAASPPLRHRAAPPPGGRARRDADRADRRRAAPARGRLEEVEEEYEDEEEYENGDNGENGDHAEEELEIAEELPPEKDPGAIRRYRFRHPTASGKTIAAAGFVEAARTIGVLILTHRRLLVTQFNRELTDEGYKDRLTPEITGTGTPPKRDPITIQTYAWFARHVKRAEPRGVPARHLRRGAHRPRREDERRDPQLPRARVHRHDRDRAADREAGLRRLPGVGRRPAARRRRPPRPDRAAPLASASRPRPRSTRCRSSAATSTRRRWPRCSTTSP